MCFAPTILSALASDDEDSVPLPADPGILTPHSRVVTIGSFPGIPASQQIRTKVYRNQFRNLEAQAVAPHVRPNPNHGQPNNCRCRITAGYDSSSDEEYCRSQVNVILD